MPSFVACDPANASSPTFIRFRGASAERSRFRFTAVSASLSSHCIVAPSVGAVAEGERDASREGIAGTAYTVTFSSVKHGLGSVVVVQGVSDVFSAMESLGRVRMSWSDNIQDGVLPVCVGTHAGKQVVQSRGSNKLQIINRRVRK